MNAVYLGAFWLMQVMAQVFFKYGGLMPERKLLFFLLGNAFGMPSTMFLVLLYRTMHPNVVLGWGAGGGFLLCQIALALLFHSRLTWLQGVGVVAVAVGMGLLAAGGETGAPSSRP